jgi:hypothetical protein
MKFWQVMANCSDTRRFTDSFTDSGHSARRISLVLNEVEMEARVGIGLTRWLYGIGYIPNEGYLRTSFLSPCVLKYL